MTKDMNSLKPQRFQDCMIDLETLGRTPGCTVLSIGAVMFDPVGGRIGPSFYVVLDRKNCAELGLTEDPETLAWWAKQSPAARQVLLEASMTLKKSKEIGEGLPQKKVGRALALFDEFILGQTSMGSVRMWGNGSDFDNPIIAAVYRATGRDAPWQFWNNRCFRTLKALATPAVPMERGGTHHNALDDAVTQAKHALKVFEYLRAQVGAETATAVLEQKPAAKPRAPRKVAAKVEAATSDMLGKLTKDASPAAKVSTNDELNRQAKLANPRSRAKK